MTWLDPDVSLALLRYACLLLLPIIAVSAWRIGIAYAAEVLRAYADPPHGRVLRSTRQKDGRWLLEVRWHGREYHVLGEKAEWVHRNRKYRPVRSKVMRGWLSRQAKKLDRELAELDAYEDVGTEAEDVGEVGDKPEAPAIAIAEMGS